MKLKRLFSILVAAVICCSLLTVCVSAENMKLTAGSLKAAPGQTVQVPITLENNPGIWGLKFNVSYDKSVLTLKKVINTSEVFNDTEVLSGPLTNANYTYTAEYSSLEYNNTNSGVAIVMEFEISKDAKIGSSCKLDFVAIDPDDIFNIECVNVATDMVAGAISIVDEKDAPENPTFSGTDNLGNPAGTGSAVILPSLDQNGNPVTDANGQTVATINPNQTEEEPEELTTASASEEKGSNTVVILAIVLLVAAAGVVTVVVLKSKK